MYYDNMKAELILLIKNCQDKILDTNHQLEFQNRHVNYAWNSKGDSST